MTVINLKRAGIFKIVAIILSLIAVGLAYFVVGDLMPLGEKSIEIESYAVSSEHGVGGQVVIVKNNSVFFRVLDALGIWGEVSDEKEDVLLGYFSGKILKPLCTLCILFCGHTPF